MKIWLIYKVAMAFWSIFIDVSHTLEIAIYVLNQLKNDSYCKQLLEKERQRQRSKPTLDLVLI